MQTPSVGTEDAGLTMNEWRNRLIFGRLYDSFKRSHFNNYKEKQQGGSSGGFQYCIVKQITCISQVKII